jgi:hypothetical protein
VLLTGRDPEDNPLLIFDFTKNPNMIHPKFLATDYSGIHVDE